MSAYVIAALYRFSSLPNFKNLRPLLIEEGERLDIKGTLLLALEGINGTISGTRKSMDQFIHFLKEISGIHTFEYKESYSDKHPFFRLKIRFKKEIVTLGKPEINPAEKVGIYVDPEEWNTLLNDPEVIVVDTRNHYEVKMGQFKNAIDPVTESFRQFPTYVQDNFNPNKHKKVALYCTGGIRCEKASSYMLEAGFENVYHLKGGILKYLEKIPAENSLWEGECFVFDQRVGIKHGLSQGEYKVCFGCRHPLSPEDCSSLSYQEGVQCPHCFNHKPDQKKHRALSRHHQILLAKQKGENHMGIRSQPKEKKQIL
jgi:UPF0176 protein